MNTFLRNFLILFFMFSILSGVDFLLGITCDAVWKKVILNILYFLSGYIFFDME